MCSVISIAVLVVVLALVFYACATRAEGFVSLFNISKDLQPERCTQDTSKCCPAAYYTKKCTGFDFARPSNFNDTIKLASPASLNAPTLPSCKVNKMTQAQRQQLGLPQSLHFDSDRDGTSTSLAEMVGQEANSQMLTMCKESAKVQALEKVISAANATARSNTGASNDLNTQDSDQKSQAAQMWRVHCMDHLYQDQVVNDQCLALHEYALPTA